MLKMLQGRRKLMAVAIAASMAVVVIALGVVLPLLNSTTGLATVQGTPGSAFSTSTAGAATPAPGFDTPVPTVRVCSSRAWQLVPSPNPGAGTLNAVAATSASDAWAVGTFDTPSPSMGKALIEHWNGSSWHIAASPSPGQSFNSLNGVTALSLSDAWAVGAADMAGLIEHWNGTAWQIVPSPAVANASSVALSAVAAVSPNDVWAVGSYQPQIGTARTLTAHWDGRRWQSVASPNVSSNDEGLTGVAAVAAGDVWAVGTSVSPQGNSARLILHWNGATWQSVASPGMGSQYDALVGVGAIGGAPGDVWTVGNYGNSNQATNALLEHWDGTRWSASAAPASTPTSGSGRLNAVAVVASAAGGSGAHAAWAVGVGYSAAWDGTRWTSVAVANPAPGTDTTSLLGVAAVTDTDVWAVGFTQVPHGGDLPLIEHYVMGTAAPC